MGDRNKGAGPGTGKEFQENMIDKLLEEAEEMPISKETKMILKEIMTKKTCLNQLERMINEIEMIHRGRPSEKFYFLQASLLFAKKYLKENTFQYNLGDKVKLKKGSFSGTVGKVLGRRLIDFTGESSIEYRISDMNQMWIEENNLEVVEYV